MPVQSHLDGSLFKMAWRTRYQGARPYAHHFACTILGKISAKENYIDM